MLKRWILFTFLVLALAACSLPMNNFSSTTGLTTTENPPSLATPASPTPTQDTLQPAVITATVLSPTVQVVQPSSTPVPPELINPLTGLPVSDLALLNRRPAAVKVQLFPRGQRPPWGVSLADVVFDYYNNNGMTRLHAVFYGTNAAQVGPVRSARLFDGQIIRMFKEIFAFGGADKRVLTQLYNGDYADRLITEGSNICPPMCRIDPKGNNYLITNTEELSKYANTKGISNERQKLEGMTFNAAPPAGGQAGGQVFVHFSISAYTRWDYDPASGRYLRFQDTQESNNGGEGYAPLIDRLNNQQISAANVVVLLAPHEYFYKSQSGDSEIINIVMNDSGPAYAFRDGQYYELKWNRAHKDAMLVLTLPDGTPFPLKPGNTWFEVVGQSSNPQKPADGAWRFELTIP